MNYLHFILLTVYNTFHTQHFRYITTTHYLHYITCNISLSIHAHYLECSTYKLHNVLTSNFLPGKLPGQDIAKQLLEAIRAKKDVDHLQTILNNIPANSTGQEDLNADGIIFVFLFSAQRYLILIIIYHLILYRINLNFKNRCSDELC